MAVTFKACVKKDRERKDGRYGVKIRVIKDKKVSYIPTEYYAERWQLSKKEMEIRDKTIISCTEDIISKYTSYLLERQDISIMSLSDMINYLQERYKSELQAKKGLNFYTICKEYEDKLVNENRDKYAHSIQGTVSMLSKYNDNCILSTDDITISFLERLQTDLLRGLKQSTVNIHLRNIRTVFNYAIRKYNDEERNIVLIKHYPFKKFQFKRPNTPAKRNLDVEIIRALFEYSEDTRPRVALAHDVFMISFCLCGINAVDLYSCSEYDGKRITYYRHKTALRKGDGAKMSVLVPDEIRYIVEKYLDPTKERVFDFYKRYSTPDNFSANVNKGLKFICEQLKIEQRVTTYYARHSFATVARNECRVSKDDIAVCLTHTSEHDITDRYINESWETVDRTQRAVLGVVF